MAVRRRRAHVGVEVWKEGSGLRSSDMSKRRNAEGAFQDVSEMKKRANLCEAVGNAFL